MIFSDSRDEITTQIKEQSDIVQIIGECIELKRSGVRYLGLCPFHGEKTPSFSVHGGQQFYHCFGCGESGDVFSFMMKYHNLDFPGAIKELAKRCHIELPERRQTKEEEQRRQKSELLYAVNEKCANLFSQYLQNDTGARIAREYLKKRGVNAELQAMFRLGYAPAVEEAGWNFLGARLSGAELPAAVEAGLLVEKEKGGSYDRFRDRIVFPIFEISGRVCGFGGRIIGEGQPKYLNSPESLVFSKGKLLLGLYQQKESIRRQNHAVLVEGNFDLISLIAHGCTNVVAPLGTALTKEQLRLVKRFAEKVTLLFDGDAAGLKAAVRAVPLFLAEQIPGQVAILPDGHDPDSFIRTKGLADLTSILEKAAPLPEFALDHLIRQHGLTLDGKTKIVEELRPLVSAAVSPLQRSLFVSHFALKLGMAVDQLDSHLNGSCAMTKITESVPKIVRPKDRVIPLSLAQKQLVEFMILQPKFFEKLEESGLRDCLAGGIGEMLFMELKQLIARKPTAEPEELLTVLPEGAERNLIAELLQKAQVRSFQEDENACREEFLEHLEFLHKFQLKKRNEELLQQMYEAERQGDQALLQELMREKIEITQRLHG